MITDTASAFNILNLTRYKRALWENLCQNTKTKTWFQQIITENSDTITKSRNNHPNEKKTMSTFFPETFCAGGGIPTSI